MANIYRAIKIWNGSAWDYIYPSVCRSITFGRTTEKITATSSNDIEYETIITDKADSDASLATLSGGFVRISRAGRYLVNASTVLTSAAGVSHRTGRTRLKINNVLQSYFSAMSSFSTNANSNLVCVLDLVAGDVLKVNAEQESQNYNIGAQCRMQLMYLGE